LKFQSYFYNQNESSCRLETFFIQGLFHILLWKVE
jgi:hypothetical protein